MKDRGLFLTVVFATIFVAGDIITTALFIGSNGIEEGSLIPGLAISRFGIVGLIILKSIHLVIILAIIFFLQYQKLDLLAGGFSTILLVSGMIATISNILIFTVQDYYYGLQFWEYVFLLFFFSVLLNKEWRIIWKDKIFILLSGTHI